MAFTFGFYNSVNHDRRYDAVQVGQIFDGIIKDGVYETYKKAMMVKASSNDNEVIIQPGRAWFNHTWSYNDANLPFEMPAPETFNERIDAVVLDINSANATRKNSYKVVKGTPAATNPSKPSMANTTEHHQYPLCYVRRHGNTAQITQSDIENAVGTSECPFVIGVLEVMDIDDLLRQWTDQFHRYITTKQNEWTVFQIEMENKISTYEEQMQASFFEWMENEKTSYAEFLVNNETAWRNWFDHVQTELDGDVAGHLQEQIDQFAFIYVTGTTLYLPISGASVVGSTLIFKTSNV